MHSFKYDRLSIAVFDEVYEPAEDSFLLANAAKRIRGDVLELGCGTGIVSLTAARAHKNNRVIAIDIHNEAVKNTAYNARINKLNNLTSAKSDLFSSRLIRGKRFDYILFNPPYLPTVPDERLTGAINHAYDGGPDGRRVLDRFLARFAQYLKKNGTVLLVHSSLQGIDKTSHILKSQGFRMRMRKRISFFFEELYLLSIVESRQ